MALELFQLIVNIRLVSEIIFFKDGASIRCVHSKGLYKHCITLISISFEVRAKLMNPT